MCWFVCQSFKQTDLFVSTRLLNSLVLFVKPPSLFTHLKQKNHNWDSQLFLLDSNESKKRTSACLLIRCLSKKTSNLICISSRDLKMSSDLPRDQSLQSKAIISFELQQLSSNCSICIIFILYVNNSVINVTFLMSIFISVILGETFETDIHNIIYIYIYIIF